MIKMKRVDEFKNQINPARFKSALFTDLVQKIRGCETEPLIFEWDKTADFENGTIADFDNETKPPILKCNKTADFCNSTDR